MTDVVGFGRTEDVAVWLQAVERDAARYAGFSVLVATLPRPGEPVRVWSVHNGDGAQAVRLPHGIHVLSNARVNTPWPKAVHGRERFAAALAVRSACTLPLPDSGSCARGRLVGRARGPDHRR
jgi:uncharacterized protein with NRDE domain